MAAEKRVNLFCRQRGLIYVDPYQVDQRNSRKEEANYG